MSVYLSTAELSMKIKYDIRYIRENLKDNVFKKGIPSTLIETDPPLLIKIAPSTFSLLF